MNARESRILSLENRIYRLPGIVSGLEARAATAERRQRALWMWGGGGPTTSTLTVTVFSGGVVAGATVELATTAGVIVATATTNSSGVAVLSGVAAGTWLAGAWKTGNDCGPAVATVTTPGTTSVTLGFGTSGIPQYEAQINRTATDTLYGSFPLLWVGVVSGVNTWQSATAFVNYAAGGACGSASGVGVSYQYRGNVSGNPALSVTYCDTGVSPFCPASGTTPTRGIGMIRTSGGTALPLVFGPPSNVGIYTGYTGARVTIS